MSDFINTVDVIGDEAVIDGLINRTITEYADDNVENVGKYALSRCTELVSLNFPTARVFASYAVNQCEKLVSVTAPLTETIEDYAFQNCYALKEALFPNVTEIMGYAFQKCTALETVSFPELENPYSLGNNHFQGCSALKNISFPKLTSVLGSMFKDCGIEDVVFESVTALSSNAFSGCKSLRKIDFHALQVMSSGAFSNCTALEALILRRTDAICNLQYVTAISTSAIGKGTGYVYVPRALLSDDDATKDYRRATNWSTYAERIRAIEDYPEICGG